MQSKRQPLTTGEKAFAFCVGLIIGGIVIGALTSDEKPRDRKEELKKQLRGLISEQKFEKCHQVRDELITLCLKSELEPLKVSIQ